MTKEEKQHNKLFIPGILLVIGMIIAAITQIWIHPLTFMILAGVSIPITVIGIIIYLRSVVVSRS